MTCIYDEATLWAWMAGDLTPEEARELEAHVPTCAVCRRRWTTLKAVRQGFAGLPLRVWMPRRRLQPVFWIPAAITGAYALLLAALLPLGLWGYVQGPLRVVLDLKVLFTVTQTALRLLLPALLPPAVLSLGMMSLLGLWGLRRMEALQ